MERQITVKVIIRTKEGDLSFINDLGEWDYLTNAKPRRSIRAAVVDAIRDLSIYSINKAENGWVQITKLLPYQPKISYIDAMTDYRTYETLTLAHSVQWQHQPVQRGVISKAYYRSKKVIIWDLSVPPKGYEDEDIRISQATSRISSLVLVKNEDDDRNLGMYTIDGFIKLPQS